MTDGLLTEDYQERENRAKVLFSLFNCRMKEGGRGLVRRLGVGNCIFSLCFFVGLSYIYITMAKLKGLYSADGWAVGFAWNHRNFQDNIGNTCARGKLSL